MAPRSRLVVIGPVHGDHLNRWLEPFIGQYEIHVFTLHNDVNHLSGVTYISLPRYTGTRLDFLLNIPRLLTNVKKLNPQLIHVHYLSSYGLMAAFAMPRKTPKILTIWGSDINQTFEKPILKFLCVRALKYFSEINSPSYSLKRTLTQEGYPADHVHVFQYGVSTERLPHRKPKDANRRWRLVSFRDWAPLYRVEKIIELFSGYSQSHDDVELHVMGRGTPEQRRKLEDLVANSPRPDLIKLHGYLPRTQLMDLLSEMDFMISIPIMDGMPLSLQESCFIGHVPMLSSIPANIEWGSDIQALYLNQMDGVEFALLLDEAKKQIENTALADRRREKVLREADRQTNLKRLGKIYESLLRKQTVP